MRNLFVKGFISAAAVFAALFVLAACDSGLPVQPAPGQAPAAGTLRITLSDGRGAARTLYPAAAFDRCTLHFAPGFALDAGLIPADITVTGGSTAEVELALGAWTITATGFVGGTAVASGVKTIGIADFSGGVTIAVTTPAVGQGTLSFSVTWPDFSATWPDLTVETAVLSLSRADGTGGSITRNLTAIPAGTISCDAGFYLLTIQVQGGESTAVIRKETVHVYPGCVTESVYDFDAYDFVESVTGINSIPLLVCTGSQITLDGSVEPFYATNKTIVWTLKDDGGTGASLSGNTLTCVNAGTITLNAVISRAIASGDDYSRDFTVYIMPTSSANLRNRTDLVPTDGNIIFITSQEELAAINSDISNPAKNNGRNAYILLNDITLTGTWAPIGNAGNPFGGRLYGAGHTIAGITLSNDGNIADNGLFGYTDGAIMSDITLEIANNDLTLSPVTTSWNSVGILAGTAKDSQVYCVTLAPGSGGHLKVTKSGFYLTLGGIAGSLTGSSAAIVDCVSSINVTGNSSHNGHTGGIAGHNDGTIETSSSGGIVFGTTDVNSDDAGTGGITGSNSGTIYRCSVSGEVVASGPAGRLNCGGITGTNSGSGAVIEQCFTNASSIRFSLISGTGYAYIGGIAGFNINGKIRNCYSRATIRGYNDYAYSGGIVGRNRYTGTIDSSYFSGTLTSGNTVSGLVGTNVDNNQSTIKNSVALCESVPAQYTNTSHRIASGNSSKLENNYALNTMTIYISVDSNPTMATVADSSAANSLNGKNKTAEELRQQSFWTTTLGWDFANVWTMGSGDYPYPVLQWQN
jgi:hypothetical protein